MSDMIKFEFLQNEIFVECFQYLNAPDIFHSFDQLNHRFARLIRSSPLHLNLDHMNKCLFNQFCQTILENPEIKENIIHLKLSNEVIPGRIESFLSLVPLNELIHLRSLSLIRLTDNNVTHLLPTTPFLSNLHYFSVFELETDTYQIISSLPKTHLRILSATCLTFTITSVNQATRLTSLTILSRSLYDLFQLFEYAPMLKYLKIRTFENRSSIKNEFDKMIEDAVHLKEFIVDNRAVSSEDMCDGRRASFEELEIFLKHMPNLKILSICFSSGNNDMYDAIRWENLLKSSMQHLSVFKFFFYFSYGEYGGDYYNLEEFQSDFG